MTVSRYLQDDWLRFSVNCHDRLIGTPVWRPWLHSESKAQHVNSTSRPRTHCVVRPPVIFPAAEHDQRPLPADDDCVYLVVLVVALLLRPV